jgi:hypothetical protein
MLLTNRTATICTVLKVVYFLCTKKHDLLGYISPVPNTASPNARYPNISKTLNYYSRNITSLTNMWHCPEQPWKSHTWIFCLSFAIFEISMFGHVIKGSDGRRVVGKWHRNLLIPCFGGRMSMGMEKYTPNRAQETHNF